VNTTNQTLMSILDAARWAPSGDNTQPWRFEVLGDHKVVVHGYDTREHCVYDLEGEASQLSHGCLLETMRIAASEFGWGMRVERLTQHPPERPTFEVTFDAGAGVAPSPLISSIRRRSVQRKPLSTRPLTSAEKSALEASLGPDYSVQWLEGRGQRWAAAKLMFRNAKLRLTMPEAYQVHSAVIEWGATESQDRVPDRSLGVNDATLRVMQFAMQSWQRVQFLNRWMAGTVLPRIQMDLIPGWACAAHAVIKAKRTPVGVDDFVAAGQAVQRFWLTATQLNLLQQPEMTPLIFARYSRRRIAFTEDAESLEAARRLANSLAQLVDSDAEQCVWIGRIGVGQLATARSTRLPLDRLMVT
jgi:hypothetical protein